MATTHVTDKMLILPQGLEYLQHDLLQSWQSEIALLTIVSQVALEVIQILPQQFRHDEKMFLVVEEVEESQHVIVVSVASRVDVLQQLDFIERLVEELLVVLDHLLSK